MMDSSPSRTGGRPRSSSRSINGLTIVESIDQLEVTAYTPLVPRTIPGDRSLQMIGVLPEIQAVSFIYAASPLDRAMTATAALRASAIAVTQRPFEYLTADVVLSEGPRRNKWRVRLGPHDAALVWGDEMAEALRPFGLYWTDGPARVGRTRQPGTSRRAGQSGSIHLLLTQFRPLLRPQIRFVSTSPVDAARSLPGVRRLGCSERGLRRGRLSSA